MRLKLVYVWLDGYKPEPNLRSKLKITFIEYPHSIAFYPEWSFDGSSTKQAEGSLSDCYLKPVRIYLPKNITELSTVYVFCEVMDTNDKPHSSNDRALLGNDDSDFWVGFEQEYFIRSGKQKEILGFERKGYVEPQGMYYCGIGGQMAGRKISEEHLDMCLEYGINIEGTNAEVALGQWEYQIFRKGKLYAADELWMSRYFLFLIAEKYGYDIELHPKPLSIGWNGSGLHTNFSDKRMREDGVKNYYDSIFKTFDSRASIHIENYGSENDKRLTGQYETQSINKFTWGVSDRGASIRLPKTLPDTWKGYLEDRRPAANANPYKVIHVIYESLKIAQTLETTLQIMSDTKTAIPTLSKSQELIKQMLENTDTSFKEKLKEYVNEDIDEDVNLQYKPDENRNIYNR
jgi:glutamine synthetase